MAISMDMEGSFRLREVFSKSFNAFGRHIVAFIILSAITHIPLYLLPLAEVHYARALLRFPLWAAQVISVVGFVCVIIGYGAIIYGVVQDLAGRSVSIAEAVAIAARRLLPLVGVSVAAVVLSRLAGPGFIILWMYWLVMGMYFVVAPVSIAEQAGVGATLSRCRFLTKGHRWQIFVVILLGGIVSRMPSIIYVNIISEADVAGWYVFIAKYTAIYSILIVFGAFASVMAAVFYYRLRLAKDGVHIAKAFD